MPTYAYPRPPGHEVALYRIKRQSDLAGAYSGYGPGYCPEGIPIEQEPYMTRSIFLNFSLSRSQAKITTLKLLVITAPSPLKALFALLAAFAAAFGYLFRALTLISQGRRRKRMAEDGPLIDAGRTWWEEMKNNMADMYWHGRSIYPTFAFVRGIQVASPYVRTFYH